LDDNNEDIEKEVASWRIRRTFWEVIVVDRWNAPGQEVSSQKRWLKLKKDSLGPSIIVKLMNVA